MTSKRPVNLNEECLLQFLIQPPGRNGESTNTIAPDVAKALGWDASRPTAGLPLPKRKTTRELPS